MANDIQLKRSSVAGRIPDAANVQVGEPVVNLTDKIIYTKNGSGEIVVIGAGTTANIAEGGSNLYFTNARVATALTNQTLTNATFSGTLTTGNLISSGNLTANGSIITGGLSGFFVDTVAAGTTSNIIYYNTSTKEFTYGSATASTVTSVSGATGAVSNAQLASGITASGILTTANVTELTNLYYTDARVYANVISIGYATNSNVALKANVADLTTSNVTEGSNLYFTDARVSTAISNQLLDNATFAGIVEAAFLSGEGSNITGLTTDLVTETSNLYFTDARVSTAVSNQTLSNATFSGNVVANHISATSSNINGTTLSSVSSGFFIDSLSPAVTTNAVFYNTSNSEVTYGSLSTNNVQENSGYLYYTNARVYANVTELGYATTNYVNTELGNKANTSALLLKANVVDLTTANVVENGSLYFTEQRARDTISVTGNGSYDNTTGVITITSGGDVTSVAGATGSISNIQLASGITSSGLLTTANVTELTNLYFTNARVATAVSDQTLTNVTFTGNVVAANFIAGNTSLQGGGSGFFVDPITQDNTSDVVFYNTTTKELTYGPLDTANVAELTNLYFTNARVYSAVTGNLSLKANSADLTTANVTEVTNLYYTNARVYSNVTQLGYITSAALSGYATVTHVSNEVANLVASAPSSLDTLNELASALGNDQNFSSNVITLIGDKSSNAYVQSQLSLKANVADLTTSNVTEGTNLYFTNGRVSTAISNQTLSNATFTGNVVAANFIAGNTTVQGGGSGFFVDPVTQDTTSDVIFYNTTSKELTYGPLDTANVVERTNLYYSNARVGAYMNSGLVSAIEVGNIRSTASVQIDDDLFVYGNVNFVLGNVTVLSGNYGTFYGDAHGVGALYAGVVGYTPLPNVVYQATADVDGYAQINFQNKNNGVTASGDIVITGDDGTDTTRFLDLGLTSSTYDYVGYEILPPNSGYLNVVDGDLVLYTQTPGTDIVFYTGGSTTTSAGNIAGYSYANEQLRLLDGSGVQASANIASTSTTTGSLVVHGGLGVTGNVVANNFIAGNTIVQGGGSGFFVDPITQDTTSNVVFYNSTTKELTYGSIGNALPSFSQNNVTSETAVYTFNKNTYRSAEFLFQISNGSSYKVVKTLVIHDGSSVSFGDNYLDDNEVTIGTINTAYSFDISGNDVRLLITPSSGTANVKGKVNLIGI